MMRIDAVWLALGASDLRGGIDSLLALVLRAFAGGAQPHHAYVFANRRADRLKVLVYDGVGMWLCTRRLQAASFAWPREGTGTLALTREQLEWLVMGLPWQRIARAQPSPITVI
ncbi:IS66 family insertion sequence element accessory protein TnpB [Rubrivivax sp.]|jgi:transposase